MILNIYKYQVKMFEVQQNCPDLWRRNSHTTTVFLEGILHISEQKRCRPVETIVAILGIPP